MWSQIHKEGIGGLLIINMKRTKKEDKQRKSPREVKVLIIRALIDSLNNNLSIAKIAKKTNNHFPTTKKFLLELEKETIVTIIRVDGENIVGACLNYNSFFLICEALNEKEVSVINKESEK